MTEALNHHLPERPRLRVPLHTPRAARRPLCRPNLGATLKPASLPFEALKAMSEHPELFRRFLTVLALLLCLNVSKSLRAAETNAPAPAAEVKPASAPATTNATTAVAPAAPASTNTAATPAATTTAPSSDSDRRDRDRDRSRGPSSGGGSSATPATNAPPGSYESFRLIAERNIFDQNRSPRVSRSSGGNEEPRRVPKIEAFALAGTMSFSNRAMAFFTSSSSQYQKALKPGDAIAGYQIATVAADHVKLEREGASVELKLNQQMRREDDGPWQVSARAEVASTPPSGSGFTPAPGAAPAMPANASDALKRLMELRAKEQ